MLLSLGENTTSTQGQVGSVEGLLYFGQKPQLCRGKTITLGLVEFTVAIQSQDFEKLTHQGIALGSVAGFEYWFQNQPSTN